MKTENKLTANSLQNRLKQLAGALKSPAISVFFGFVIGGIIMALSGVNPFVGIAKLIAGGYGGSYAIGLTLSRATPIVLAGLAAALAWGSGYETMGVAGQMTLGAFTGAVVAANMQGPPILVAVAALMAGALAGVAYSMLGAWISATFEIYLLIVTLMLNYVAENIASYLTNYVFRDPYAKDNLAVQTQEITTGILPKILGSKTLHLGFVFAVAATFLMYFIVRRTSFGYQTRMNGLNPRFAQYGGVNSRRTMYLTLVLSGAIAGFAGATEALGTSHRFVDQMVTSPGYAWSGITASLMSSNHPIGIFFSSIFLAGLATGGATVERSMKIPREITLIIQGVLTVFVTAQFVIKRVKHKKAEQEKKAGGEPSGI